MQHSSDWLFNLTHIIIIIIIIIIISTVFVSCNGNEGGNFKQFMHLVLDPQKRQVQCYTDFSWLLSVRKRPVLTVDDSVDMHVRIVRAYVIRNNFVFIQIRCMSLSYTDLLTSGATWMSHTAITNCPTWKGNLVQDGTSSLDASTSQFLTFHLRTSSLTSFIWC